MTPEEARRVNALTARMVPRCVGRYLIDLPEPFVVNRVAHTVIDGITFETTPTSAESFGMRLSQRRRTLEAEVVVDKRIPSLEAVLELPDGRGMAFNRSETGAYAFARTWELWSWSRGFQLVMTIDANNMAHARPLGDADTRRTDVEQKLAHLLTVYARTRLRPDDEIPSGPGVCFPNGFLQGPPGEAEWIDMYHHWDGVPDVYASFSYMSDMGPLSDTLLERGAEIEKALAHENGRTLRKGHRSANGLEFDEWLSQRQPETKGPMLFDMTAELNSQQRDERHPLLVFGLLSGVEHPAPRRSLEEAATARPLAKATLNAAETVALWDRISATLRPRPGAF